MTKKLFSKLEYTPININFKPSILTRDGNNAFMTTNRNTNTICLNQSLIDQNDGVYLIPLLEEMFHMYQYDNGLDHIVQYDGNVEFEAKVFIAILIKKYGMRDESGQMTHNEGDIFMKYYRNPEDVGRREDALDALYRLGYGAKYRRSEDIGKEGNLDNLNQLMK